ncbi:uncharacterized protein MKK02DRAFT_37988 [Dioszegia hungarica]|uniref:RRM domain-containing protein n=1 Tax=Dioszegia hungarica TaxID=4972 RepID=A0AA38H4S1_9TREE|nr:uncharacterized protein MKK02DRAFT_37988 [Dioszegia hungarica]KAI9634457.1 hypothetical protein MKK02DRAFT_37988 [Dioszegia hungarica]
MSDRGRSRSPKRLTRSPSAASPKKTGKDAAESSKVPDDVEMKPAAGSTEGAEAEEKAFKVIVVSGLTKNVHKGHLEEIFGEYGKITGLDLPLFKVSGLNRGKAAIEFEKSADAEMAVKHMEGGQLDGAALTVQISEHPLPAPQPASPNPAPTTGRRRYSNSRSRSPINPPVGSEAQDTGGNGPTRGRDHLLVGPEVATGVDLADAMCTSLAEREEGEIMGMAGGEDTEEDTEDEEDPAGRADTEIGVVEDMGVVHPDLLADDTAPGRDRPLGALVPHTAGDDHRHTLGPGPGRDPARRLGPDRDPLEKAVEIAPSQVEKEAQSQSEHIALAVEEPGGEAEEESVREQE